MVLAGVLALEVVVAGISVAGELVAGVFVAKGSLDEISGWVFLDRTEFERDEPCRDLSLLVGALPRSSRSESLLDCPVIEAASLSSEVDLDASAPAFSDELLCRLNLLNLVVSACAGVEPVVVADLADCSVPSNIRGIQTSSRGIIGISI